MSLCGGYPSLLLLLERLLFTPVRDTTLIYVEFKSNPLYFWFSSAPGCLWPYFWITCKCDVFTFHLLPASKLCAHKISQFSPDFELLNAVDECFLSKIRRCLSCLKVYLLLYCCHSFLISNSFSLITLEVEKAVWMFWWQPVFYARMRGLSAHDQTQKSWVTKSHKTFRFVTWK